MRIDVQPFEPRHLQGFEGVYPLAGIDQRQVGEAAVFLVDGKVAAICGGWQVDDAVEIGVALATWARRYPVTLHKTAKAAIRGFHMQGHVKLRAWPADYGGAKWLRRLGFEPAGSEGAYEKCQIQQH